MLPSQILRRGPSSRTFPKDKQCSNDDHYTFEDSTEEFCLVVAIGVIGISGFGRDMDRDERGERCCYIDRAFKCSATELRPVFRTVCLLTLRCHFPSHIFESLFWRFVADA